MANTAPSYGMYAAVVADMTYHLLRPPRYTLAPMYKSAVQQHNFSADKRPHKFKGIEGRRVNDSDDLDSLWLEKSGNSSR